MQSERRKYIYYQQIDITLFLSRYSLNNKTDHKKQKVTSCLDHIWRHNRRLFNCLYIKMKIHSFCLNNLTDQRIPRTANVLKSDCVLSTSKEWRRWLICYMLLDPPRLMKGSLIQIPFTNTYRPESAYMLIQWEDYFRIFCLLWQPKWCKRIFKPIYYFACRW